MELEKLKAKLSELLGRQTKLEEGKAFLDEDLYRQQSQRLDEEIRRIQVQVTESHVAGGVVTHDSSQVYIGNNITQYLDSTPEALLKAYYRHLAGRCARLPLLDIEKESAHGDFPELRLPDVFVSPRAVMSEEREEDRDGMARLAGMQAEDRCLLALFSESEQRRLVLLGDAGGGKTAFVDYLTVARWLDARLQQQGLLGWAPVDYHVRLPTEAEWEKAARHGHQGRYPWGGDDWEACRANVDESAIGEPSAVGMYPAGASPFGIKELAGNVWEWTRSRYRPYPYRSDVCEPQDMSGGIWPCCAGVPGAFFPRLRVVRAATGAIPISGTPSSGFAWCCPWPLTTEC